MTLTIREYAHILRNDFTSFIHRAFYELNPATPFVLGPHIEVIASKLEAVRLGKCRRLIINLPPRYLKSHCASVAFAAWLLGHNPSARIICVSYGQDLADKFSRDTRRLMECGFCKQLFPTRLGVRKAVHDIQTTAEGMRFATSVGGVLTGLGADIIIIDDPLKPDDALSETRRKAVNEWYDGTLLSRLNNKSAGAIVIIMQRLHQDDLVGHVLEQGAWEVVSFPAIAETEESHLIESPLGRRVFRRRLGDALHPERDTVESLLRQRDAAGEYNFTSQYQQSPVPPGGSLVKTHWLKSYVPGEQPATFGRIIQSWDTANKASELSDYSVCVTIGVHKKNYYVLDVFREKLNFPDLKRAVIEHAKRYKHCTVLIEDKASGTQLIQDLKGELFASIKAYEPPPGNDKVMRLNTQTPAFENGHVFLPREATWLHDYVTELTGFPGVRYDDQVDATAQALHYLQGSDTLEIWRKLAG